MEFLIQYPAIRPRRSIGKLAYRLILPRLGNDPRPATPPRLVKDKALRDGHHPGRHLRFGSPPGGRPPDIQKYLLSDIFSICRTDHPGNRPHHKMLVPLDKFSKCSMVARGNPEHYFLIGIFGLGLQ
jgi:hypothetical protein